MDFISKKTLFKKRVITVWALVLLMLHVLFTLLSVYHGYIKGDIIRQGADTLLGYLLPILGFLIIYVRFSVMVSAYHSYDEGTLPFTLTVTASLILSRVCDLVIKSCVYSNYSSVFKNELFGAFLSFMIDLAVVIIILLFSRSKKERQRKATRLILITCAFPLVISLFEESWFLISFLQEINELYGSMAITTDELWSIIWAFAIPIIEAVLGFILIFLTHKILLNSSNRKVRKIK